MTDQIEIRGGAGEAEAAVIAAVLQAIKDEEASIEQRTTDVQLPAWVRASATQEHDLPVDSLDFDRVSFASP